MFQKKVIDYESCLGEDSYANNFANIHTFYQHCMSKLGIEKFPGMNVLDIHIYAAIMYAKNM